MTILRLYSNDEIADTLEQYRLNDEAQDRIVRSIIFVRSTADESYRLANRLATMALDIMDCAREMTDYSTEDIVQVVNDLAILSGRSLAAEQGLRQLLDATAETLDHEENAECFSTHIIHQVWAV
jgi:hypothetical protein